jgi:predicted acyl esterase
VEVFPTSYVFPAGHRIRVAVSGSDCCTLGSDPNPTAARVTVYHYAAHPSHVKVPVIGAVAAQNLRGRSAGLPR